MRIISPIAIEVLLGALVLVYAQEPTTEAIQPYEFGFNDGLSTRQEQQTADGVVKGSYSYIDAYGEVQKVSYSADAVNGYVVHTDKDSQKVAIPTAATNLDKTKFIQTINEGPKKPVEISKIEVVDGHVVDTPEVAAAKALHFKAFREAEATAANDEKPEKPILRKVPAVVQPKFALLKKL
uniref:Cuticle protein 6 n=1 Tax=Megaselia scalaris TaxID=36166 RepID=T1GIB9_MEGSC